jgi:trans-aconitate methyltransferase
MAMIARQLSRPSGPLGRIIGRGMARRNADFSKWVVGEIRKECPGEEIRIVELGPGPGIGLQETLKLFPQAQVWGIDLSPAMLSQSRKRNLAAVRANRLSLIEGDSTSVAQISPVDIIFANHVFYF